MPADSMYPAFLSRLIARPVINQGVGGETSAQILARSKLVQSDAVIIWMGRNSVYSAPDQVPQDIAQVAKGHQFVVLSIINGDFDGQEWKGQPGYLTIEKINRRLKLMFSDHYLDIRSILIASYDPNNPRDVVDHQNDVVPSSLRLADQLHLNAKGQRIVAEALARFITQRGF